MTDEKSQKTLISHFVGNWLVQATFTIEQGKDATPIQDELVDKLKSSEEKGTMMNEAVKLIRSYDWSTKNGLEDFRQQYFAFETKYGMVQ
ncbi:MAG: hypothetical protein WCI72_06585 [archaeon]